MWGRELSTVELGGTTPPTVGFGIGTLAEGMANHPAFGRAWVRKLCMFANSGRCAFDDPELARIATEFTDGGLNFKHMMRELLSSPIVTFWEPTQTWRDYGVAVSIARREDLCARIGSRLGIEDICELREGTSPFPNGINRQLAGLATGVPATQYVRGAVDSVFVSDPSLFSFSATERFCSLLASRIVAGPEGESIFTTDDVAGALDTFVHTVVGLPPSDPQATTLRGLLLEHYEAVTATGENAETALRSTFVVACSSPVATSSGL